VPLSHVPEFVAQSHKLPPAAQVAYGDHPDQVGNLHLPAGDESRLAGGAAGTWPAVVLIHGGFWRWGWDRTLTTRLAHDLAGRGFAAWNIEYRRVGQEGGGWPGTFEDVAAAVDALGRMKEVDTTRVAAVGHSAGGHLALWLAARRRLPARAPGAAPGVSLRGAVSQAGVCDLVRGAVDDLGGGACAALLGGSPAEVPERYAVASPAALLPLGVSQLLVHGDRDDTVPPGQSRAYVQAARAADDDVDLVEFRGADHFDVVEPGHASWIAVVEWLRRLLVRPADDAASS
jgi:acetyl esterase/lipase